MPVHTFHCPVYLLKIIQEQYQQICWLILFICRYIPLKQWAHDELHSPEYQKFLTDKLPVIKPFIRQNWLLWIGYCLLRYGKAVKPVKPQKGKPRNVPADTVCPLCGRPYRPLKKSMALTFHIPWSTTMPKQPLSSSVPL